MHIVTHSSHMVTISTRLQAVLCYPMIQAWNLWGNVRSPKSRRPYSSLLLEYIQYEASQIPKPLL